MEVGGCGLRAWDLELIAHVFGIGKDKRPTSSLLVSSCYFPYSARLYSILLLVVAVAVVAALVTAVVVVMILVVACCCCFFCCRPLVDYLMPVVAL